MKEKLKKPQTISLLIFVTGFIVFVTAAIINLRPLNKENSDEENEQKLELSNTENQTEISDGEPRPTATDKPSPTNSTRPTARPNSTLTPTKIPSATPNPTSIPTNSPTSQPTVTLQPTNIPQATPTLTTTPTPVSLPTEHED